LKAFRGKDGKIRIFRPDENALRMAHSAQMISIPVVPEELFLEAVELAYFF
jgi:branched-chain amino acid aminotransferase